MLRVVVDPGVCVSAVITPAGAPAKVLDAARNERLDLIVSPRLLAELAGVLEREKFRDYLTLEEAREYVDGLAVLAETVSDAERPPRISRDPNDDYLIALAQGANATIIVSGDADLLAVDLPGLRVLTPHEFVNSLEHL